MEDEWRVARARLRALVREDPTISHKQAAQVIGYSVGWVRKWRKRFEQVSAQDEQVLQGLSRRPKHSPTRVTREAEERVIHLRTSLAEVYHRPVGARTILAYLHLGGDILKLGPHSTATIWRILRRYQYIQTPRPPTHEHFLRPDPGTIWELDFCTIASQSADAPHKQQQGLEVLNAVDRGTSAVMHSQAATNYDAEYSLQEVARMLAINGVPYGLVIDRDPR